MIDFYVFTLIYFVYASLERERESERERERERVFTIIYGCVFAERDGQKFLFFCVRN